MGSFGRTGRPPSPFPVAPPPATAFPAGMRLLADRELEFLGDGRVAVGGSPLRAVRLRPRGADMVQGWLAGRPVGGRGERRLARRLVAAGLLHPRPEAASCAGQVTVVVPVRDRHQELARLLATVRGAHCIVVDDASRDQRTTEKTVRDAGADYVRLEHHSGPAAARNAGLARVRTPFVAFVDSDCVVPAGWLEALCGHFSDPRVALVAPRVMAMASSSVLGRYEGAHTPLDMGALPGRVAPGTRISYVPSAAVVLRTSAVGARCFDERLAAGEDVDLVWRLVAAGWEVRYDPAVEVRHEGQRTFLSWVSRRVLYGATAGPLGARHPSAIAPARIPAAVALSWLLVALRRPVSALAVAAASCALLTGRLAGVVDRPGAAAVRLTLRGTLRSFPGALANLCRTWSPVLVLGLLSRRRRVRVGSAAMLATSLARGWRQPPDLDPVRYGALRACDDLAYGAGVWWGCLRSRTVRPLVPTVLGLPRRRRTAPERPD